MCFEWIKYIKQQIWNTNNDTGLEYSSLNSSKLITDTGKMSDLLSTEFKIFIKT